MRHYGSDRLPIDFDINSERRQLDEAPYDRQSAAKAAGAFNLAGL
jgi:hypothetical protein